MTWRPLIAGPFQNNLFSILPIRHSLSYTTTFHHSFFFAYQARCHYRYLVVMGTEKDPAKSPEAASQENSAHGNEPATTSPLRSTTGWDGKLRVDKKAVVVDQGALSDGAESEEEHVHTGTIEADEGWFHLFLIASASNADPGVEICWMIWKKMQRWGLTERLRLEIAAWLMGILGCGFGTLPDQFYTRSATGKICEVEGTHWHNTRKSRGARPRR
jgi:hypothetical protein